MTTPGVQVRYVVLRHDGVPAPHNDFMIESAPGGALATWRADAWPPRPGDALERLPEHRRAYLDYEGPVSDNRGSVCRVARGVCAAALTDSSLHVRWEDGSETTLSLEASPHWRVRADEPPTESVRPGPPHTTAG